MNLTLDAGQMAALASAVSPFLWATALKGILIMSLAGFAVWCLRRSSAATRHLAWFAAMTGLLALPLLTIVVPSWRILPHWTDDSRTQPAIQTTPLAPSVGTVSVNLPTERIQSAPTSFHPVDGKAAPSDLTWSVCAFYVWLVGALVAFTPAVLGMFSLWQLRRNAIKVWDADWMDLLQQSSTRLNLRHRVTLLQSFERRMPMTWGWMSPKLLLPAEAAAWSPQRRRLVLLHELAHVRRRDFLTNLITQTACALHWFNPLAWLAAKRMRVEREQACDDLVLSSGSAAIDYAEELLDLAAHFQSRAFLNQVALPVARRTSLEGRLRAILDGGRNRAVTTRRTLAAVLALLTAIVVPVAALRSVAAEPTAPQAEEPAASTNAVPAGKPAEAFTNGETSISRSYQVEPAGKLVLEADRGNVEIAASDESQVKILIERSVTNGTDAENLKMLKAHQITITHEGNEIRVRARLTGPRINSWWGGQPNLQVQYTITVPRKFAADLTTGGGNLEVAELQGRLDAKTGGGNASLKKISGPSKVQTGGGNIDADACAAVLKIQTGGGNIDISGFTGASIDAETGGGSISADLAAQPKSGSSLQTGGGDITVKLPKDITANLDASTGGGQVTTDISVTTSGTVRRTSLHGTINGGGPGISIATGGGDIRVEGR